MSTTTLRETKQPPAAPRTAQRPVPRPVISPARTAPPVAPHGYRTGPDHQAVLSLPAEVRWVPAARHCVAAILAQWRFPSADRESAELVVDELTANAAQYGRRDMTVHLSLSSGVLRISVTDSGVPVGPRPPRDAAPDEHGRGLAIVELLASEVRMIQGPLGRQVSVVLRAATTGT
ncbi:ATP-binding protein [Streptomyces ochraceiscleroticus]|uniref:ATP-binding protein n=1 Tax=Streptomyces ochraceiscleroticus TaxID=47761 RepID=A0ABW1MJB3_9ACTN|nr:ATP-binding protein [Streptomyces ochraceiscleroticus]